MSKLLESQQPHILDQATSPNRISDLPKSNTNLHVMPKCGHPPSQCHPTTYLTYLIQANDPPNSSQQPTQPTFIPPMTYLTSSRLLQQPTILAMWHTLEPCRYPITTRRARAFVASKPCRHHVCHWS